MTGLMLLLQKLAHIPTTLTNCPKRQKKYRTLAALEAIYKRQQNEQAPLPPGHSGKTEKTHTNNQYHHVPTR